MSEQYHTHQVKQKYDLRDVAAKYTTLTDKDTKWKRGPCPKCGGKDRFTVSEEAFQCRKCHTSYEDVIEFMQWVEDITFEEAMKRLDPTAIEVTPNGNGKKPKDRQIDWSAPIAEYLYTDELKKIKYRVLDSTGAIVDKTFRWQHRNGNGWEKGTGKLEEPLYNLSAIVESGPDIPIYFCEGEKDADNLTKLGFIATTKPSTSDSIGKFIDDLSGREVIILEDNDQAGKDRTEKDAPELLAAGCRVKVITPALGGWSNADKEDVSDWIERKRLAGLQDGQIAQALQNRVDNAPYLEVEPPERVFKPLSLTELFNLPSKQWLWGDFIGAGDLVMIFGESGKGKTFAAIDLIVSGAAGMPYAGKFEVTRPLRVAYCAGEGVSGLRNRFMAAINRHKVNPDSLALQVYCNVPQLFDNNSAEFVSTFVVELAEQGESPDLVVIDTLHAATRGADENHAKDAGLILAAAKQIVEGLGATVLLVHHSTKAGNSYRGSSALHGAMDTIIQVRMNADGKGEIECYKQKDAEYFPKLYFELEAEHYSQSAYVQWLEASTVELNEEQTAVEKAKPVILDTLGRNGEPMNQTDIVNSIDGVGRNNIISALRELENEHAVTMNKSGAAKFYQINHTV
ncbi:MAG: AAA family ATPase [Anaerolineae bacterium]|nr:AAA family ATPase [Anaerolineae bacterium]